MLGERVKELRKTLKLTQREFANRIGMKQNSIGQIEIGRNPSDQTIISICREFNVNESWLRTGEGEMFIEMSKEDEISSMIHNMLSGESADFKERLIKTLSTLKDDQWIKLEQYLKQIAGTDKQLTPEEEARAEAEEYYQEILEEKKTRAKSSVSQSISTN